MRVYSAYLRRGSAAPDAEAVFVREGFSWLAFLFAGLWALGARLWLVALLLFAADAALSLVAGLVAFGAVEQVAIGLGYHLLVGFVAADLKRWTLARRDYREVAVVAAPDRLAAERRFFDGYETPPPAPAPGGYAAAGP